MPIKASDDMDDVSRDELEASLASRSAHNYCKITTIFCKFCATGSHSIGHHLLESRSSKIASTAPTAPDATRPWRDGARQRPGQLIALVTAVGASALLAVILPVR